MPFPSGFILIGFHNKCTKTIINIEGERKILLPITTLLKHIGYRVEFKISRIAKA